MTWNLKTLSDALATKYKLNYLVDEILPENALALFYGAPGSLKTMILLDMLLCCSKGSLWLESENSTPIITKKSNVLWIDMDNGEDRLASRIKALSNGNHISDVNFYYVAFPDPACTISNKNIQKLILELVEEHDIDIICFDNLASISGDIDENSAKMKLVMLGLRNIIEHGKCTAIVIHHTPKIEGSEIYRGHSTIGQYADLQILVSRAENNVHLKATKERDYPVSPIDAIWKFETDQKTLTWGKFERVSSTLNIVEKDILFYLYRIIEANQSHIITAIQADTTLSRNHIIKSIEVLEARGEIESRKGSHNSTVYYIPEKKELAALYGQMKRIFENE